MKKIDFDKMSVSSDSSSVADKKRNWNKSVRMMKERLEFRNGGGITSEGIREMILYHGLKEIFSTSLVGEFLDVCFSEFSQEFLLLANGFSVKRFSVQGKPVQPSFTLSTSMGFTKIFLCHKISIFLGYIPHDDLIWLLTLDWKLIQIVRNEFRVDNLFYFDFTNEMIVIGPTKATRYLLDRKEQTLNSWKTITMLDTSAGPTWKIECSSIIHHEPEFLKLAASYLSTIYVIPLYSEKDEETNIPVKFLSKKINASSGTITTLYFHDTSRWIISGDQQGNVIGWSVNLEMMMNCLQGHKGSVKLIISHPSICGFISSSDDHILQVWSCNLREKIESFKDLGEITSMTLNNSGSSLAVLGGKLNCFHMHQLYSFFSPLTSEARILFSTTSTIHPTRVIIKSNDNILSVLSSASGRQLNVQIIPKNCQVISLAYSEITDCVYILMENEISISSVKSYPMKIRNVWENEEKKITCLVAFDSFDEIRGDDRKPLKPRTVYPICTRIIVGTSDGTLITVDESTGSLEETYPAHDGPVTGLYASQLSKQIISIGKDNCVKVWKIYPSIEKCLGLFNSIYFTVPITLVASMGSIVCAVSSTNDSEFHQLFMYDNSEKTQIHHHASKDHTGKILDIAVSEFLEICATSSLDGVIKIWDHQNDLVKILQVNICARHVAFSSKRGDIIFSAGKHLYRLSHENYLPPKYRGLIAADEIEEEIDEYQIFDELQDAEIDEGDEEKIKALHPVSSVPLGSLDPSADAPRLDLMLQEQMCLQLKFRDEDILRIKRGELEVKKMLKRKANMKDEEWEKYINDMLGLSTKIDKDVLPSYDILKNINEFSRKKKIPYTITSKNDVKNFRGLDGFLPNSLAIKIAEETSREMPSIVEENIPLKKSVKYIYPPEVERILSTSNDDPLTISLLENFDENIDEIN